MAWDDVTAVVTAAQIAAGNVAAISQRPARGYATRMLVVFNGTNVTLTFSVQLTTGIGTLTIVTFALATIGTAVLVGGVGFSDPTLAGAYTRTGGNEAGLNGVAAAVSLVVQANAGATTGTVNVELTQQD